MKRIIVHKGPAHRDELIAVALCLGHFGDLEIVRRDPTEEEMSDPHVIKLDVGGAYNPELFQLDHHHDRSCPAAFHLVMRDILKWDMARAKEIYPWIEFSNLLDTQGPLATAKQFNMPIESLTAAMSPIERLVLDQFAYQTNGHPVEVVEPWMRALLQTMGKKMIQHYVDVQNRLDKLDAETHVVMVRGIQGVFHTIADKPSMGMDLWRKTKGLELAFSITPDDRGEGFTLFRFDDNPAIDFSKLAGLEGIAFAHKGGFIAKTCRPLPTPSDARSDDGKLHASIKALCDLVELVTDKG